MIAEEFFLIRPKSQLEVLLSETDTDALDEFLEATIWTESFDMRTTGRPDAKVLLENAVKLKFLAYAASQQSAPLGEQFEKLTPDVFDQLWTIEWINGGMTEGDGIYGDLTEAEVGRLSLGSCAENPQLAEPLNEFIEHLLLKVKKREFND